jgi:hypothetical protein
MCFMSNITAGRKAKKLKPSNFASMPVRPQSILALCMSMLLSSFLLAQGSGEHNQLTENPLVNKHLRVEDSVELNMDPTLERYIGLMDSLDQKTLKARGYRIQIFSASGPNARKDALQKQAEFLKLYSQGAAYTKWNYPNWVVRLGDFRTHLEAMEFHHEIRQLYPASFIVTDEIKVD